MASRTEAIHRALGVYADSLHAALGIAGAPASWPEDQLKSPVKVLLESVGKAFGHVVVVKTEATQQTDEAGFGGGRVDAAVLVGSTVNTAVLTGHVELKAPSKSADPKKLTGKHDKTQWTKFQRLPNLIYTNGREWTLQRTGKQEGFVRLSGDPIADGAAAVSIEDAARFEAFLESYFLWAPIVPKTSKQIADLLAPLCRLLRAEVLESLSAPASALSSFAIEMRKSLFPGATSEVVADAFAQTYTYALLIARFEGADPLNISTAKQALAGGHGLLGQVLGHLDAPAAHAEVATASDTLLRVIGEMQPEAIVTKHGDNPWLYFYEEFLAAYDPALRKQVGAYYTPVEVVKAQVAFVRDLLVSKFGKPAAFADSGIVTLDPAVGTGTYPLGILQSVLDSVPAHMRGSAPELLRRAAENLYGFEYLIGPYSVAHLRLSRFLADHDAPVGEDSPLKILLADTLASHEVEDNPMLPAVFGYEEIIEERQAARDLKVDTRVVVCIGNPPYLRGKKDDASGSVGGWVTTKRPAVEGAKVRDAVTGRKVKDPGEVGILRDFIDPAIAAGRGGDVKNLYNAYVYFWRWALWKTFEQERAAEGQAVPPASGIVSFITASSYLRGPGFVGMREHLRRLLDEVWIVDLGGDNRGGRKSENVFSIETPVAILTGVRYGEPRWDVPATVHYATVADLSAADKRQLLGTLKGAEDAALDWTTTLSDWQDPFLPSSDSAYLSWPALTDLFPWQVGGSQVKRSWPIGETEELLERRWAKLTGPLPTDRVTGNAARDAEARRKYRAELFKESRDREVAPARSHRKGAPTGYPDLFTGAPMIDLGDLPPGTMPEIRAYAYRSFDLQYVIADARVGDYMRPALWRAHSPQQRYFAGMLTKELGRGPALVATREVPDLDTFANRGGHDIIPLFIDAGAKSSNVTTGLLAVLAGTYGREASAEELFAYCYGLLAPRAYVDRFWDALTIPGPRVPLTKDVSLFERLRDHGETLLELHAIELFDLDVVATTSPGTAVYAKPISKEQYPEAFTFDSASHVLKIGDGEYADVAPEVWEYSVSGLRVVDSWLGYRMKGRAGKKSSKLDELRPAAWPDPDGSQLLRLLWTLEKSIAAEPAGAALLEDVLTGPLFVAAELPEPNDADRDPTGSEGKIGDTSLALF